MVSDERLIRRTGRIRAMGIFVIFLLALAGMPEPAFAGDECQNYIIHSCIKDCSGDDGQPCGEQLPGCAGQGSIECREASWCPHPEYQMLTECTFAGGGAPPGG
jgi:hypothetical protein